MSGNDDFPPKRDYFPNEDFEKTVQDIITSPRKGKHYQKTDNVSVFDITDKQKAYYTKCFLHLMKSTQNCAVLNGALFGGDDKVIEFFKKSGLDTDELSKIWGLSDVNEDGWLDVAEFTAAMHLIVLRVKGEVPIPPVLPPALNPPLTPARTHSQVSSESSQQSCESRETSTTIQNTQLEWSQFDECDGSSVLSTRSEEKLSTADPPQFSDVPPLLVDGRPTAIKARPLAQFPDAILALRSPHGPPPAPPPRPMGGRGHMRSASLDLKQLNVQQARTNVAMRAQMSVVSPNSTLSTSRHMTMPSSTSTIAPPVPNRSELGSGPLPSPATFKIPALPPTVHPLATAPVENLTIDSKNSPPVLSPPIRPPPRKPSVTFVENGTQTEAKMVDQEVVDKFIREFGTQLQDLLGREDEISEGGELVERWAKRCDGLRLQNSELEKERARLAQVRIQLELRLSEMSETQNGGEAEKKGTHNGTVVASSKPTKL